MAENSKIEWTDHTFNPWTGCRAVSPACDHCYAESWAKRCGRDFAERRLTTDANWRKPLKWDAQAKAEGRRYRVFCASLADVFDTEVPDEWRDRLFALIALTPNLDWLLLTKRPKVARDYLGGTGTAVGRVWARIYDAPGVTDEARFAAGERVASWPLPNVWLGTTVENQDMADLRIPVLLDTPATKRFVSMEPLLGPVDLTRLSYGGWPLDALNGWTQNTASDRYPIERLDWVIVGGESGHGARPMHPYWAQSLRNQCAAAQVPFFMKQLSQADTKQFKDFDGFPLDIRVRQFPRVQEAAHA